jgi:hypothetical protein
MIFLSKGLKILPQAFSFGCFTAVHYMREAPKKFVAKKARFFLFRRIF